MDYKNILIIKMSALGDVMHAIPCAAALREVYPNAKISWIVHPQFGTFVPEKPYIDEVIYFDKKAYQKKNIQGKIAEFMQMKKLLSEKKYDLVIDLQGLFKSAVIAWMTGCKTCIGYNDMRELSGFISKAIHGKNDKGHVVQQYLDVIRYLGSKVEEPFFPMPALVAEKEKYSKVLQNKFPNVKKEEIVAFVPGAGWVTKEWPVESYIELGKQLIAQGKSIVLAGGPAEIEKGETICKAFPEEKVLNLVSKTNLKELAALMDCVGLCIGGDTGPIHIATAMGCRIISLFGASSGHRAGPYGEKVKIISTTESCAPCFKRKCPKGKNCMMKISVAEVLKEV